MAAKPKLEPSALLLPLAALAPLLLATGFIASDPAFKTTLAVHWVIQLISGIILGVCALSVYRGNAVPSTNPRLLVVAGLAAAALLEISHALLLTMDFAPNTLEKIVPWGWLPSRVILPTLLLISIWVEFFERRRRLPLHRLTWTCLAATALCTPACLVTLAFFADALPAAYVSGSTLPRPSELLPAILFFLTVLSFLYLAQWRRDIYQYNFLLSLVVAVTSHGVFMLFAETNFNNLFAAAVLTKLFGYVLLVAALILQSRDRIRAENKSERVRHRAIVETASDAIVTFDAHGVIDSFNSAATRLFGYTAQEAIGENVSIVTPMSLREPQKQYLEFGRSGRAPDINPHTYEAIGLRKDGSTFEVEAAVNEVQLDDRLLYTAIIRDISQRKAEQASLEELSDRLTLALESANLGMWEQDLDSGKLTWNAQMFALYGRDPALGEPTNSEWIELAVPEDREKVVTAHEGIKRDGVIDLISRIRLPDGRIRWIRANGKLVDRDGAHPLRLVGINQDVSDGILHLEELETARNQADEANRAKSSFLATMSHEIRTPLNGVIGLNEVLQKTALDKHQKDLTNLIDQSANALLEIIEDVLDLSKIEAGKMDIDPTAISPGKIVRDVCSMLTNQAKNAHVTLEVSVAENIPRTVLGDGTRLRQILTNLTNNAIKFSSKLHRQGKVAVSVRREPPAEIGAQPAQDAVEMLSFTVTDNGLGMEAETMARLFSPFTQADASTSRQFGGTGLGLTISQSLAKLMGGEISVSSQIHEGSTFTLKLPFAVNGTGNTLSSDTGSGVGATTTAASMAPAEHPSREEAIAANRLILVAEDNPTNQRVILHQLSVLGFCADMCNNGKEALEAWRCGDYAVLLTDLQMPETDGYELARQVRALESADERIPIIAVSANTLMNEADNCLAAGMDAYLSKPVSLNDLQTELTRWLA